MVQLNQEAHITEVGIEFADKLAELWVTTFKQAYTGVHPEEDIAAYCTENFTSERAYAMLAAEDSVCLAYIRDDSPTGFYVIKTIECPFRLRGGSAELKQIYVHASEYGSGAGQSLLEHARATIRSAGNKWIWLSVSDKNQRAQAFYMKNGFEPLGPGPVFEVGNDRLSSTILTRVA